VHLKVTGDDAFMKEFYPSVKKAMQYSFSSRTDLGPSQIIAMPPHREHAWNDIEWYEHLSMYGYVTHPGKLRLAGAEMLKTWAHAAGDSEEVAYLDTLIAAGKEAMQKYLWKGDHYLIYNDPKTGKTLDALFSPTLNGQYFARFNGVPPVFPKENVESFLALMRDKVCKISKLGMPPIYAEPDGSNWKRDKTGYLSGEFVYTNFQVIFNAITFMYEGQKDFGLELLRKNLHLSYCDWGYMWDGTCSCSAGGDTGGSIGAVGSTGGSTVAATPDAAISIGGTSSIKDADIVATGGTVSAATGGSASASGGTLETLSAPDAGGIGSASASGCSCTLTGR